MYLCTYVLFCPATGQIRYVGKSEVLKLDRRQRGHVSEARRKKLGRRGEWLRWLAAQGLEPIIEHDKDIPDNKPWQQAERERIAYYLSIGCALVNDTDGGEGLHNPSPEWRAAQSARLTGKTASAETRARMSTVRKGRKHSEEWKANISAGHVGKAQGPHTDEQRARISASLLRYYETHKPPPITDEQKAKISDGLRRYFASIEKPIVIPDRLPPGPRKRKVGPRSPEHKANIAAALRGRKHTTERRAAQSAAKLGKKRGPRPPEVRAKISVGRRARTGLADQGSQL